MEIEIKMAYLWDRIKGPSGTGLFPPRTQTQRPESQFISSATLFYLEIHLVHRNILLAGSADQIMLDSWYIVSQNICIIQIFNFSEAWTSDFLQGKINNWRRMLSLAG